MKAAVKTEDGPMHSCFGFAWLQERSVCTAAQSAQPWPVLYCMPRGKGLWSSWDSSSLSSFQQTHTLTHCHRSARAGGSVLLTSRASRLKEVTPQEQRDAEEMMPAAPSLQGVLASLARQASGLPSGT